MNISIALPSINSQLYGWEIGFQSGHSNKNAMSFINELNKNEIYSVPL